jgi:hypothetical protein
MIITFDQGANPTRRVIAPVQARWTPFVRQPEPRLKVSPCRF